MSGSTTLCKAHNLTEPYFLHMNALTQLAPPRPSWVYVRRKMMSCSEEEKEAVRQRYNGHKPPDISVSSSKNSLPYFTMISLVTWLSSSLLGAGSCLTRSFLHSVPVKNLTYHMKGMVGKMFTCKVVPPLSLRSSTLNTIEKKASSQIQPFLRFTMRKLLI